ncbi:molybdopterin-containing oxidoreductase family protein, partial [[Eubacterium] cellulosolvens]
HFVEKWCHGFGQLTEHVQSYSPEKVAQTVWVPAEKIREAATLYAKSKPAVLHHRVATEQNVNAVQTDRALCMMIALSGNLDVRGGNLLPSYPKGYIPGGLILGGSRDFRPSVETERKRLGSYTYPLISGPDSPIPFVHPALLIDAISRGNPYPVKAAFCTGANPVVTIEDSERVWDVLKKLRLLIVVDFFMTPTAEIADYVLPATMWPERDECCDQMYTNYVSCRRKAVDPPAECWDDLKIAIELVKRIPWANRKLIPWESTDEFNDWQAGGSGLDFKESKGAPIVTEPVRYRKFEWGGFNTPTKKVELYSTILERHGYDPLPVYVEPPESPYSTPDLARRYPYILTTGGRQIEYFSSEGRQIPGLRRLVPDPLVEVNSETAKRLGVDDGDWVFIETPQIRRKRVRFRAKLTRIIDPRVVHASHGWWFPERSGPDHGCFESNPNVILSLDPPRGPICRSARTRGTLCRIYKA